MKMTERDKNLLIGISGILFLAIAWFIIASPLKDRTEVIRTENITLKATAELYQAINARADEYDGLIASYRQEKDDLLAYYPANVTREDQIMFWANTENRFYGNIAVSTLAMNNWEELFAQEAQPVVADTTTTDETATDTTVDAAATDAEMAQASVVPEIPQADVHLFKAPIQFGYNATYGGLKSVLQYFYTEGDKKSVDSLSVAFDSTTGNLTGSVTLNLYYMLGTDKEYQPTTIPSVQKGVSDVFHTVRGNGLEPIEEETEESEE